jgi:sigma-B regulation protein RsbU (phosphoserine phosphatase)
MSDAVRRLGVRVFLFLVIGVTSALPLIIFGLHQANQAALHEVENSDRQARAASQGAALVLQDGILGVTRAAETLSAQLAAPNDFEQDSVEWALIAYATNHPELLGAYVADAKGDARAFVSRSGQIAKQTLNYADRDYFKEILKRPRTVISKVGIGRFTRTLSVQVVSPVLGESDRLLGITCSSLDLTDLAHQAEQSVRGLARGRVIIVDAEGKRVADSSGVSGMEQRDFSDVPLYASLPAGQSVIRYGPDDRHEEVRAAVVGLSDPVEGWRAIATIPKSQIDAQAQRIRWNAQMFGGSLLVLALLTSALLAVVIARPLKQLAEVAKAVAHGDLQQSPTLMPMIPRELALLTVATQEMIRSLREMTENLAQKVAARTEELSIANADLDRAFRTIQRHQASLEADIAKARHFQERMLPRHTSFLGIDVARHFAPLQQVGGDIYDVFEVSKRYVRCFIGDVTGHGIQASMRTILLKSAYDRIKTHHSDPAAVLTILNRYLVQEFPDGDLHCTACCVDIRVTPEGAELSYANAGGPPMFVLTDRGAVELYAEGPLLGVDDIRIPGPSHHRLNHGEFLLFASDGLTEQPNSDRQRFEMALARLTKLEAEGSRQALTELLKQFDQFRGDIAVHDDVTVLVLRLD